MTTIIEMVINGICIGFGSAIGTYLGTKFTRMMIEKRLEEIKKLLENKQLNEIRKLLNKKII